MTMKKNPGGAGTRPGAVGIVALGFAEMTYNIWPTACNYPEILRPSAGSDPAGARAWWRDESQRTATDWCSRIDAAERFLRKLRALHVARS
jgi:hypothetical protein